MTNTVERFDVGEFGPAGASVFVAYSGRDSDGRQFVTSDLAASSDVDFAVDELIRELERVRAEARSLLPVR